MYEHILVPLDGSELAEEVLEHVTPIAEKFGSELILLEVVPTFAEIVGQTMPRDTFASPTVVDISVDAAEEAHESEQQQAASYLGAKKAELEAKGLKATVLVYEHASTPQGILAAAAESGADLVAMSTHGRTGLGRAVFGSVADEVMRKTGLPVLLIRKQE